jgi:hypothetical protein
MACRGRFRPAGHVPQLTLRGPVGPQRGPVTSEPQLAEGVDEAALPVQASRPLVVACLTGRGMGGIAGPA